MTFVSYTRDYEDYRLYQALKDVDQGRYIDFSSPEGGYGSVSQAFYERGWSGRCRCSTALPRQRDQYVTGSLVDLVNQTSDWINSEDVQFLAVDADMLAESLQCFLVQTACRPWLILVRRVEMFMHHAQLDEVLKEASYSQCWSDGVNVFWVAQGTNLDLAICFEPLTHLSDMLSHELLQLRAQYRMQRIQADELARTRKKLTEREKEIEQLNLGLESTRQSYQDALAAYHVVLASTNRLPIRIARGLANLPRILLSRIRRLIIRIIRWPALKLLAYFEHRPLQLKKLMQMLSANPMLEKLVRKTIGKPKLVPVPPRRSDEMSLAMSPDEVKAYQQITLS